MRKQVLLAGLLALILLALSGFPALAQGEGPGKVIFGGHFTLRSGERLLGDLGVLGGTVELEEGSQVAGDVLVAGGSLRVAGSVEGDIAIFGGTLELAATARVDGDVVHFGGIIERSPGAVVTGEFGPGPGFPEFSFPGWRGLRLIPQFRLGVGSVPGLQAGPAEWLLRQLLRLLRGIGMTMALAALALVVTLFWPSGIELTGRTEIEQPVLAFVVGLLTLFAALLLAFLLAITICLLPVTILLLVALGIAVFLAWVAAGWVVGHKLLAWLNLRGMTTVVEVTVGTALVVMLYFILGILPCVNFIYGALVASLGVGALVLTRFGTQPYRPGRSWSAWMAPRPPTPVAPEAEAKPEAARPEAEAAAADATRPTDSERPGVHTAAELGLPPAAAELAERVTTQPAAPTSEQVPDAARGTAEVEAITPLPEGDDLQRISGIGPTFAQRLREAGIVTYAQLARLSAEQLAAMAGTTLERVRRNRWIEQARDLAEH